LTKEAANALLKTLEEPPSHAIFVLATTEIHKMIPTIISRCQRFDFRKLTMAEIVRRLEIICQKEKAKIDRFVLELIALNSAGAIRDAESLLDQVLTFAGTQGRQGHIKADDVKDLLGLIDINLVSQFVDYLSQKKGAELLALLNEILEKGRDPQEFAKALNRYLRQILLFKINPEPTNPIIIGLTKEEQEKLKIQSEKFERAQLHHILDLFLDAENKMKYSSIPQLPLELAIVDIMGEK